jgi:hypothetical protein
LSKRFDGRTGWDPTSFHAFVAQRPKPLRDATSTTPGFSILANETPPLIHVRQGGGKTAHRANTTLFIAISRQRRISHEVDKIAKDPEHADDFPPGVKQRYTRG